MGLAVAMEVRIFVVWAVAAVVLCCLCGVNGFQAYPQDCKQINDAVALQQALRGDSNNNFNGRPLCLRACASLILVWPPTVALRPKSLDSSACVK